MKIIGWIVIIVLALAFVGSMMKEGEENLSPAEKRTKRCGPDNETMAFVVSKDFVEKRLKAPSTADFPWSTSDSTIATLGGCRFSVRSYVDAQNGFGAMIRTHYSAVVRIDPQTETWYLESLDGF